MLTAKQVYMAHQTACAGFASGMVLPFWEQLPWRERDNWQRTADELNAADREETP